MIGGFNLLKIVLIQPELRKNYMLSSRRHIYWRFCKLVTPKHNPLISFITLSAYHFHKFFWKVLRLLDLLDYFLMLGVKPSKVLGFQFHIPVGNQKISFCKNLIQCLVNQVLQSFSFWPFFYPCQKRHQSNPWRHCNPELLPWRIHTRREAQAIQQDFPVCDSR